jgi:hypothetical protein
MGQADFEEEEEEEEESLGDDRGDDQYVPEEEEEDDEEEDEEEDYAEEGESLLSEDEDPLGPWGEHHPEVRTDINSNSRVKYSPAETKYIEHWIRNNPTFGARALYSFILTCPRARKIFHAHHVELPDRIDWKFKDMKKRL